MKRTASAVFIFLAGVMSLNPAFAKKEKSSKAAQEKVAKPAQPTESQKAQQEMMARWMKNASPNENHKILDAFVGKWNYTVRTWMGPQDKPMEGKGTGENKWILGGRFLYQEAKGVAMGQEPAFEGMGLTGYDNLKEGYESVWVDNMTTGILQAGGHYDPGTKTIVEMATSSDPMTSQKEKTYSAKWKIVDNDHFTYEMYTAGPDGKEFRCLEILYERAK